MRKSNFLTKYLKRYVPSYMIYTIYIVYIAYTHTYIAYIIIYTVHIQYVYIQNIILDQAKVYNFG